MVALWSGHAQLSRFYVDSMPRGRRKPAGVEATELQRVGGPWEVLNYRVGGPWEVVLCRIVYHKYQETAHE